MKITSQVLIIIIVAILIIASATVFYLNETAEDTNDNDDTDEDDDDNDDNNGNNTNDDNGDVNDTEPPTVTVLTRDTNVKAGETIRIEATFEDNVEVTEAILYYKTTSASTWQTISILTGKADIAIPNDETENYSYYVTVDDEAGNGPVGDPSTDGSEVYQITVEPEDNGPSLEHTVFIEEGTGTWCSNCPQVSEILHDLYESSDYNFYYVSMVEDKNTKAASRLTDDYNIHGYPTLYIDGGYERLMGSAHDTTEYIEKITQAQQRAVPAIEVTVQTTYQNTTHSINTTVTITNYENAPYDGTLRVYLTEIVSRWNEFDGTPYHFAFIDYLTNTAITIAADQQEIITKQTFLEDLPVPNIDEENIMIYAVVFNAESHSANSDPNDNTKPFDAYYADAVDATKVVEGGNLPPAVGITTPTTGRLHLMGRPLFTGLPQLRNTIVIGKTPIQAHAEDDSAITLVEFYINDELVGNDTEAPYEWSSDQLLFKKPLILPQRYTITVTAYDDTGKNTTATMQLWALRAFGI